MALINMSEAAKLAGIGRTTLYRYVKNGRISVTKDKDGSPAVDTAELARCFTLSTGDSTVTATGTHIGTREDSSVTDALRREVEHLRQVVVVLEQNNMDLRQSLLLIGHNAPKAGFWSRLFGK